MPTTVLHASTSNYALKSTKYGKRYIQPVDADGTEPSDASSASSHAMKTTKRGRPFLQDTYDLFATLILSLELGPHKKRFFSSRTFDHSFTIDEAARNLASLTFSHSTKEPSPDDLDKCRTVTTRTTYIMTRPGAKAMCQHFMDAYLLKNAAEPNSTIFKSSGIYQLTPKGLHILNRFVTKNNINANHIIQLLASQPQCTSLFHLERRTLDDEVLVTQATITALFRRFAGPQRTYANTGEKHLDAFQMHQKRAKGMPLITGRKNNVIYEYCFLAVSALEWLCEFTSICDREEAAELAAHFVRYGLIRLANNIRKRNGSAIVYTVSSFSEKNIVISEGQFKCHPKAMYQITDEGRRVAGWGPCVPPGVQQELNNDRCPVGASMDSARTVTNEQDIMIDLSVLGF